MTPSFPLRHWLQEAPFGLALSSGFFGFFAHLGLVSVLEEEGLLPGRISGSSAGALIGGLWASGLDTTRIRDGIFGLRKADFWDPGLGAGLLKGRRFNQLLEQWLPVRDFSQCRIPLAVSSYDLLSRRTRVLDQGLLAPAIQASCSLPVMFQPVRLAGRVLFDGGVKDRPGLAGMPAGRVLYHHLASRSPWRGRNGAHTKVPHREGLQAIVIENLPRVGPNQLEQGRAAFAVARNAMKQALSRPATGDILRIAPEDA
jgi:NTE family protein